VRVVISFPKVRASRLMNAGPGYRTVVGRRDF
jgi:hypothetical protein